MRAADVDRVLAFRLARHRLSRRAEAGSLVEVARALCGVHAQLASSAELALWARVEGLRREDVRDALEEHRSLVKTWAMRGTLHLLPADDLAMYVAVLGHRWDNPGGAWLRGHGVREEHFGAIRDAVPRALDGRPRTREQLAARVAVLAGSEARDLLLSGWGALLKPSAQRGDLCFGPMRGRNVTFVRPDRWLGRPVALEREQAEREVVRRYLRAYGPATHQELGRWLGVRGAAPKQMLGSLEDELVDVEVDGKAAVLLAEDLDVLRRSGSPRSVRLLPAFDPYVVGSRPRELFVAASHEPRIFRAQGWISPVVLVEGRAAGIWKHERQGRVLAVQIESFTRPNTAVRRKLSEEAERLGGFLGLPVELSWANAS